MSVRLSEELKEALLRAKGKPVSIVATIGGDGNVSFLPDAYSLKEEGNRLVLEKIMPIPPSEAKKMIAKQVASKVAQTLDVEKAIEAALLEKTDEQLARIATASGKGGAQLERRRGCFWLVTDEEEILI